MIIEVEKDDLNKIDCPLNAGPWCKAVGIECCNKQWNGIPTNCPLKQGDVTVRFKEAADEQ